jgi:hypothetical protein
MDAIDLLSQCVLPLLLYSGATVPIAVVLILDRHSPERHRKHRRLLNILLVVQAASFLPFIIALVLNVPEAIHGLLWPALSGVVLFLCGLFVLASECFRRLASRSRRG